MAVAIFIGLSLLIGPWFMVVIAPFAAASPVLFVSFAAVGFLVLPAVTLSKIYEMVLWPNEKHKRKVEWKSGQPWNT